MAESVRSECIVAHVDIGADVRKAAKNAGKLPISFDVVSLHRDLPCGEARRTLAIAVGAEKDADADGFEHPVVLDPDISRYAVDGPVGYGNRVVVRMLDDVAADPQVPARPTQLDPAAFGKMVVFHPAVLAIDQHDVLTLLGGCLPGMRAIEDAIAAHSYIGGSPRHVRADVDGGRVLVRIPLQVEPAIVDAHTAHGLCRPYERRRPSPQSIRDGLECRLQRPGAFQPHA